MPIAVIGMHRSGTSMLAGMLHHLGVHMGTDLVMDNHVHNPLGYFEDRDFLRLNERILTAAGGGWAKPPGGEAIAEVVKSGEFENEIMELAEARTEPWGWKDPRTSLTLPVYQAVLPDMKIIVINRQANAVVESLLVREPQMELVQARILWAEYERRVWENTEDIDCITVQYEEIIRLRGMPHLLMLNAFLGLSAWPKQVERARDHIKPELNRQGRAASEPI